MARPVLEVADIFHDHGPAWREANRGHVSLDQLKVMSAIERCRTAALGGHVARCENAACGHTEISFNSCRNRHCPKCQAAASRQWLADREAELLPVPLCSVPIYVLFGAKSHDHSVLTSCFKEHKFLRTIKPLGHHFQGGLTCLICFSLVETRSRDTN
jgi:Transposase zinc-binding domain